MVTLQCFTSEGTLTLTAEQKNVAYTLERRSHALSLSINNALHSIQNIEVFSNHALWPDNKEHWNSIRSEAETVHVALVKLKMKLDFLLSEYAIQKNDKVIEMEKE